MARTRLPVLERYLHVLAASGRELECLNRRAPMAGNSMVNLMSVIGELRLQIL
jgi:hypothetical protein